MYWNQASISFWVVFSLFLPSIQMFTLSYLKQFWKKQKQKHWEGWIFPLTAPLTPTSLGFPTPNTSTHLRDLTHSAWAGPSLVEFPVKKRNDKTQVCDWCSVTLVEHINSKNKISLDPRLYTLQNRDEGTPVTGQGVMKRHWGALLRLLWVQVCCESGSSQKGDCGECPTADCGREGRRADPELLDGPTSSWVFLQIFYRSRNCISDSPVTSYVFVFLFPSRGERDESGAEPFSAEPPGRHQLYLRCNFSATMHDVQWSWRNPGGGIIHLFFIASGMKQNGGLISKMNSKELYSTLHITSYSTSLPTGRLSHLPCSGGTGLPGDLPPVIKLQLGCRPPHPHGTTPHK